MVSNPIATTVITAILIGALSLALAMFTCRNGGLV
jgi:hypothetical protein